jgi:hypothetical protein
MCASYELDDDARQTQGFIQVRPPWGRNTYFLRQIVLFCMKRCNEMCFEGVPRPPYIVRRAGLQIWKLILVGYNCQSWPDKDSYSNQPGSYLISKFAFLSCTGRRADQLGHASSLSWAGPTGLSQPKSSRRGIGVDTPTVRGLLPRKVLLLTLKLCLGSLQVHLPSAQVVRLLLKVGRAAAGTLVRRREPGRLLRLNLTVDVVANAQRGVVVDVIGVIQLAFFNTITKWVGFKSITGNGIRNT